MTGRRDIDPRITAIVEGQRRSRRQFLRNGLFAVGGLAMGPTLLAACSNDDETTTGGNGSGGGGRLRISNWPLYMAPGFNDMFTDETGIAVDYLENFQDNETWFAANQDALAASQDIGADLIVPTDFLTGRLITLGWLSELDDANIPNKSNVRDDLLDLPYDPGLRYSVPYMAGMLGIAYNKNLVDREIRSVDDLWDPEFRGRVTVFSDMRDALGMVMMAQGNDPADATEDDIRQAADVIAEQKANGQIRRFTGNDYADDLTAGNVVIAQVYSGDVAQLQEDNPDLEFVVPEAGTTQFVDTLAIPVTTRNKEGAEAWMNFVYDRENYALLIEEVQYIPVLSDMTDVLADLDPELAESPLVNPDQETLDRLTSWRTLSDEEDQEFASIYADVTSG
jgi:spermidine/putrescine transport system substrate-binding protein